MPHRSPPAPLGALLALSLAAVLLAAVLVAGVSVSNVQAAPPAQETAPPPGSQPTPAAPAPAGELIPNEVCLGCHNNPNLTMSLENGEVWGLFTPPEVYARSVHSDQAISCVQCHTTVGNYPHPPFSAQDTRHASLQLYGACQACHQPQYEENQDSVHAQALEAGNRNAAICTDCHSAHAVQRLTDPQTGELLPQTRQWIPQTCAKCHYAIYQRYATSVHGAALLGEGNPDVPTCIDCHGVHSIEDPTTARFRLSSPQICAGCHTDPQVMDKYGLSTHVLDTYVADFHGTTVTLFARQHPDQQVNQPVCYDCHGVHDIVSTRDPERGLKLKENLLARCQVCHPDATANFSTAWLSHYIPSPDRHPLVFTVDTFYKFFIPGVLGGMLILVVLDARWRFLGVGRRKPQPGQPEAPAADAPAAAAPNFLPGVAPDREGPPPEQAPPEQPPTLSSEPPGEPGEAPRPEAPPGPAAEPEAEPSAEPPQGIEPGSTPEKPGELHTPGESSPPDASSPDVSSPGDDEETSDG